MKSEQCVMGRDDQTPARLPITINRPKAAGNGRALDISGPCPATESIVAGTNALIGPDCTRICQKVRVGIGLGVCRRATANDPANIQIDAFLAKTLNSVEDFERCSHLLGCKLPAFAQYLIRSVQQGRIRSQIEQAAPDRGRSDIHRPVRPAVLATLSLLERAVDEHRSDRRNL